MFELIKHPCARLNAERRCDFPLKQISRATGPLSFCSGIKVLTECYNDDVQVEEDDHLRIELQKKIQDLKNILEIVA